MDLGLQDKVVFIAGASRGIGLGMARAFLEEGAKVAITGRTPETLEAAYIDLAGADRSDRVIAMTGDMRLSSDIIVALDRCEKELGPLHCAIANIGIGRSPGGVDIADEDWDADLSQNLTGSMFLARETFHRLRKRPPAEREHAGVIFVSSIAGVQNVGTPIPYAVAKAALNHATRVLSKQVGPEGIRVNAIAPGNIMFPNGAWDSITRANPDLWRDFIQREVAMQRFGRVEEIADTTLWLASERSSFVTGTVIVVDGGQVH